MHNLPYLIFLLLCLCGTSSTYASNLTIESGYYYSQGEYGRSAETQIQYLPLALKYQVRNFQFKVTSGRVWLHGPGHIEAGSQTATQYSESGWADSYLAAAYWWRTPWLKYVDWLSHELKLKVPTADKNKALGTGEYDGQLLLAFYQIKSPLTLYSTVSHRWRGDRTDLNMHNSWGFNLGTVVALNKIVDVGLMYDYEQASSSLSYPKQELVFHTSVKVTRRIKSTFYSQIGLDSGSPEFSIGTQIGYKF